jgi:polyisoprenyl-teichoic acid--peptidoglycan teichoic acid transferase
MAKDVKKKKKSHKFYKVLSFILVVFTVLASSVLVYFDAIPTKYLIPGLIIIGIIVLFIAVKLNRRTCLFTKLISSFFSIILILIECLGINYAFGTIDFLNDIFDTGLRKNTYSVYVLNDSKYASLNDLKSKKIVIYKSESTDLNSAISKLESKVKFTKVVDDSLYESVNSLINKENDALYISDSLMDIYNEDHADGKSLKKIASIDVVSKNTSSFKSVNVAKKPFVLYLSGVDTSGSINNVSRSDVNILLFVNPEKGKIFILSTPRDYYVNLAKNNRKDKLTHAGIYGIEESANTLAKLYGTTVNYYARVNFTSFVNIIDKLGGITVDVEKPDYSYNDGIYCGSNTICEQNSQRKFGKNMIYIKSGTQILNGEEALAYARNRHQYSTGDNARGEHQAQIIEAVLKKAMTPAILTKYNSLLKSLSKGVLTNVEQRTITKLVNLQLDDNIKWDISNYSVTGTGDYNVCYSTGSAKAWVMNPDEKSISEAKLKIASVISES